MRPVIIAHRGASGYRPEHTLAAKTLAHEMGADYLEQDIVASADDELVVLHDIYLDRVSDVAARFPGRARDDGRYYVRDFGLAELRELRVREREAADGTVVYPGRYPARTGDFRIHTFAEELELVLRLNGESGRRAGVYPEIKRPAWHREEGVDLGPLLQKVLAEHGFGDRNAGVFVQCFDAAELRRLREELDYPWPLVQLIGVNSWNEADTDYMALQTRAGLESLAGFADAVGPWLQLLYALDDAGAPCSTGLAERARACGLAVHAYTVRDDELAPGFSSLAELVRFFTDSVPVDGFFTDFPDTLGNLLRAG
jgi:glycerophosphoryl diester phosphodiesterase